MKMSKETQEALSKTGVNKKVIYSMVKEVAETRSIKEVAKLLHTGKWVAISATFGENPLIVLGKIDG